MNHVVGTVMKFLEDQNLLFNQTKACLSFYMRKIDIML